LKRIFSCFVKFMCCYFATDCVKNPPQSTQKFTNFDFFLLQILIGLAQIAVEILFFFNPELVEGKKRKDCNE
jgi:hypothetical protein